MPLVSVPHQPTRPHIVNAAYFAHMRIGAHQCESPHALFVHHLCSAGLWICCLDAMHHASCARQRMHTMFENWDRSACFRATLLSESLAFLIRHFWRCHRGGGVSARLARTCRDRWDAAISLRR